MEWKHFFHARLTYRFYVPEMKDEIPKTPTAGLRTIIASLCISMKSLLQTLIHKMIINDEDCNVEAMMKILFSIAVDKVV